MASDVNDVESGNQTGYGVQGTVIYRPRRGLFAGVGFDIFDEKLDFNDFGFMRRNDFASVRGNVSFIGSNWGPFRTWSSSLFMANDFNIDGDYVDGRVNFSNAFSFANRSSSLSRTDMSRRSCVLRSASPHLHSTIEARGAMACSASRIAGVLMRVTNLTRRKSLRSGLACRVIRRTSVGRAVPRRWVLRMRPRTGFRWLALSTTSGTTAGCFIGASVTSRRSVPGSGNRN